MQRLAFNKHTNNLSLHRAFKANLSWNIITLLFTISHPVQLRPFGKQTHRREDIKLPHGYLGDCVSFFHDPAVAVVTMATYSASGIHRSKVGIFFVIHVSSFPLLSFQLLKSKFISHISLFLALSSKNDLGYVSIQNPKVAVLLLPGSTFHLDAYWNVWCTVWIGHREIWLMHLKSRVQGQGLHRYGISWTNKVPTSTQWSHSHRRSFRWN